MPTAVRSAYRAVWPSQMRAVFAAARSGKSVVVGFHGRRSHHVVPIRDCAVVTPGVLALLPKLEQLATVAAHEEIQAVLDPHQLLAEGGDYRAHRVAVRAGQA